MGGQQTKRVKIAFSAGTTVLAFSGLWLLNAQEPVAQEPALEVELATDHADCALFGPKRARFLESSLEGEKRRQYRLSQMTVETVARIESGKKSAYNMVVPGGSRTNSFQNLDELGTIDGHLWRAMQDAGVTPAPKTTSFEFARRVTLDLTGRIPSANRLLLFASNDTPNARRTLVEELLASPEWVDKWTMFFGDLVKNTAFNAQVQRYPEGRNAFYRWIRDSLAANKPYNQMVTEMIAATGTNSYEQGELNWIVGGRMNGGPRTGQDHFDLQAANAAEMFLGLAHMNCILCHDGRRHLDKDNLSLWGGSATRLEGYQLASFFSRTDEYITAVGATPQPYYWGVRNNQPLVDYPLNTTTGNRPPRTAIGTIRNVAPVYPFSGRGPQSGEAHRAALARELTADFQFARAAVNYIWAEFFGKGLVNPTNQFDLARLDPDNPPPAPWTLQPLHPRLLNELARDFINSGFNLKELMRQMVNSESYHLASRYEGAWNPTWENLFARKFVRRLWGEEIHDAIVTTSGILPRYQVRDNTNGPLTLTFAMQFPEPRNVPGGAMSQFLDSFFRGNREDEDRRSDASSAQALNLMNDTFVMTRIRATGTGANASLLARVLGFPDEQLLQTLYLTVLSRYPSEEEKTAALATLKSGNRTQKAEDLLWTLYNKTDFLFNY